MTTKYITFTDIGSTVITAKAISPDGLEIVVNQPIQSLSIVPTSIPIQTQPVIIADTPPFTQPTPTTTPPPVVTQSTPAQASSPTGRGANPRAAVR